MQNNVNTSLQNEDYSQLGVVCGETRLEIGQSSIYVIRWVAGSIISSTKRLMVQVLF